MKLADVKRYYRSDQGIYLSEENGIRKVDKMGDLSLHRQHAIWNGTDRPEYTDIDGISKVCVEAERENELDNPYFNGPLGGNPPDGWLHADHSTGGTVELIESAFSGRQAVRLATGASERSYITNNKLLADGTYTISMWLESFSGTHTGSGIVGANISSVNYPLSDFNGFDPNGEFPQFVWYTFEKTGSSTNLRIGRGVASNVDAGEMVFSGVQVEEGSYPTNLVDGTRLAPTVPIEDALPETGTVAGKVDMVRDPSTHQFIFDASGTTSETLDRSRIYIQNNGTLHAIAYGSSGGSISTPFPSVPDYSRMIVEWAMGWDQSNLYLFLRVNGESHFYTTSHQINDASHRDIYIGSSTTGVPPTSTRFLVPWEKTDQVLTTEEEFEQLFETIS